MNKAGALSFLKRHQPLPDDSVLDEETIRIYDECREYFLQNPDPECVPLFLHSFGNGDGFGVYPLVGKVISQFDKKIVLPHLITALQSERDSIRYWCAQIAEFFPDVNLVQPLASLLKEADSDIRAAAINALAWTGIEEADQTLKQALEEEHDPELREAIQEALDGKG